MGNMEEKYKLLCSMHVSHPEKEDCDDFVDEDKKMNWALPSPDSY